MHARTSSSSGWRLLWSRWLVLAVLSLTLPLQGALAVTMQVCGPEAPIAASAVSAAPSTDDLDMAAMVMDADVPMDHAGHHAMAHDDMVMDHASHTVDSPSPHDGDHGPGHGVAHKCSICAQCCVGAAIPVAPLTVAQALPHDALPVAAPAPQAERLPQSLDRPPKSFLA